MTDLTPDIEKLARAVADRLGQPLDAKELRRVVDTVVEKLRSDRGNEGITGGTCSRVSSAAPTGDSQAHRHTVAPASLYERVASSQRNRVIVAAFGTNRPGIVAALTQVLAELTCSIEDISQTIMQEFFSMIMIVDISNCNLDFSAVRDRLKEIETRFGMKVFIMHEDTFAYMHRI